MFLALNYCNVTEDIIQNLVRSVDSDLSGNLCFEEFVALIILVHQEQNNQNTEPVTSADTTFQIDTSKFSNQEMQRFFSIFRSVGSYSVVVFFHSFGRLEQRRDC